ncbi:hypothetical protein HDV05_008586 [Chytridiales sp. JEL 0842]|nr:hypothetical protein HDV05_008586 [Chytridiales sp. JEL 0842]
MTAPKGNPQDDIKDGMDDELSSLTTLTSSCSWARRTFNCKTPTDLIPHSKLPAIPSAPFSTDNHQFPFPYILAPMVSQSHLPFRLFVKSFNPSMTLAYTPMIHTSHLSDIPRMLRTFFDPNLLALPPSKNPDRPLVAQIAGHNPSELLQLALHVAPHVDAIDLNLGCPQDRALEGMYGSALLSPAHWDLVSTIIKTLKDGLDPLRKEKGYLPLGLWAKIRLVPTTSSTIQTTSDFALMLQDSGVDVLAIHARFPSAVRRRKGLADLNAIREIRKVLRIPVIANGNVRDFKDVLDNMKFTGCEGVMVGESLLANPLLFAPLGGLSVTEALHKRSKVDVSEDWGPLSQPPDPFELVQAYLHICRIVSPSCVSPDAVKGHVKNFLRALPASKSPQFRKELFGVDEGNYREGLWSKEDLEVFLVEVKAVVEKWKELFLRSRQG